MAVTDGDVVDGIAYENETLIMEIYDHLDFEGKFDFDHISILQDKINTYLWYINSKQYIDVYPNRDFKSFIINVHFLHKLSDNCEKFLKVSYEKLLTSSVKVVSIFSSK